MILKEKNRKDSESKMQISQGGVTRPPSQFESYSLSASSKSYSERSYSAPKPDYDLFLTGNAWLHSQSDKVPHPLLQPGIMNEFQLLQIKDVKMKIIPSLPSFYSSTEVLHALCQSTLVKRRLFHRCLSFFLVCEWHHRFTFSFKYF